MTVLLGMSVNLFSLVPAAISETYGSQRTASVSSFANTMGQFSGATVLAVSGYVGISLNTQPGNALTEYRGIWLSGLVGMAIMAILGTALYIALRTGWTSRPAPSVPQNSSDWSLTQEVEVTSELRPEDSLRIQPRVAPRGRCGSGRDLSTPPLQVRLGQQHVEASLLHADSNPVTRPHQSERSADRAFRRDVEDDRAEGCTAHARVGDPDHVLHARPRKLGGYRQVARFGHPGANRPRILQHQRIVGMNVQIRIVDAGREIVRGR